MGTPTSAQLLADGSRRAAPDCELWADVGCIPHSARVQVTEEPCYGSEPAARGNGQLPRSLSLAWPRSLVQTWKVPNQSVRTLLKTLIDMSDKPQAWGVLAWPGTFAYRPGKESSSRRASAESPEKSNEETPAAEKDSKQPETELQSRLQMISMSGQMSRDNSGDEKPCLCRPSSSVDTETDLVRGSSSVAASRCYCLIASEFLQSCFF